MGATGGFCTTTDDCQEPLTCLTETEGFPGGYCSAQPCPQVGCPGSFATCAFLDPAHTVSACVESCNTDMDCRTDGYICADLDGASGCLPGSMATTGAGSIGASCAADGDCDAGLTCMTNFVFGYCSKACVSDGDCGSDGACIDQGGGTMRCMDGCTNNSQCRFSYSCTVRDGSGVCDVDATTDAVRNPSGQPDGQPCVNDINCQGGTCIVADDFPGGYCTTMDCDIVGCSTANSTCVNLQRDSLCFVNCNDASDCRDGYRCTTLESGGKVCYSLPPIQAPDAVGSGSINIVCDSTGSGNTRTVRFNIGSGTDGFVVVPFSPAQSEVAPTRMTLPDGQVFDFERDYSFQTINSLLLGTIVPMFFPASPSFAYLVQPGQYVFEYETDDASSCYYVLEQSDPGTTLDVNFYLVGVPGVTSATADTDASFQAMLSEFRSIYSNAGISIGTVRTIDITGADRDRYAVIRDFGEIYRLLALSTAPGSTLDEALSVNVFLIQEFNISELPGLLGLSAGIPGVPGVHGNGGAGLVFTSADLQGAPDQLGQTMGHEVGHFLGLRHTSERGGSEYDPLDDTPRCSNPEDPYGCPDVGNLMFPFAVDTDQSSVTANQRFVLQRNPLVK
ncbi:MAG: hypothetical protein AUK47_14445 [Deltaproteobacteria bacterium CG2_30_63_29]|nr:MAG: hypothetical protein AUK47_14445 [Deltaproteobacteria bacterium CG2_30_63_29]PIW00981.1 MAG: hypothetical protein COW42_06285 [Deltaproteobacteria bacterium CG17_big_fil_post_rev_8_21_14_2_50_63_7]PJB48928.1 MAG: hypothetical protein CO108_01365 [Deltaproteobacteria bacterium CG_4_9_14_3_um_filter_63_12]